MRNIFFFIIGYFIIICCCWFLWHSKKLKHKKKPFWSASWNETTFKKYILHFYSSNWLIRFSTHSTTTDVWFKLIQFNLISLHYFFFFYLIFIEIVGEFVLVFGHYVENWCCCRSQWCSKMLVSKRKVN